MSIRLQDARGFWRVFQREELRWINRDTCAPRGQVWIAEAFRRDATGTFLSAKPAIGPASASIDEMYRPDGWSFPETA